MLTAEFLGLDAATWVNVALATLTALLTVATFVMARRAKAQADAAGDQAKATAKLVVIARQDLAIAERALAATATPLIVPIAPLGEVTGGRAFGRRTVVAYLRNLGGANAEYQSATLTLIYGGEVMQGRLLGHRPVIQPDEQFRIQFAAREEMPSAGNGRLEVHYQGPGSGTQRVALISVGWDGEFISFQKMEQRDMSGR
jgi:hypothetical protein